MKIIEATGNRRMNELSQDQVETLEKTLQMIDKTLSIEEINYQTGTINVGITYNRGTDKEWTDTEFIKVNVNGDSQAAAFHDVYLATYDRCMY